MCFLVKMAKFKIVALKTYYKNDKKMNRDFVMRYCHKQICIERLFSDKNFVRQMPPNRRKLLNEVLALLSLELQIISSVIFRSYNILIFHFSKVQRNRNQE